jgi:protein SCO1/2
MKRKWVVYIAFFTLLLGIFYLALLPDFDFSKSKLAIINAKMPYFSFVDQNGTKLTTKETEGKVYVAEYFFTTCSGICPRMNANMRRVYDAFGGEKDFMIISHTCMPETDSVPLLKAYERWMINGKLIKRDDGSYKIMKTDSSVSSRKNSNWFFVTGDKADLYKLARQGYMIDNGKPDSTQRIGEQFIHTQFFALVDRHHRVRGIYDGLKEEEIQKLLGDIPELMREQVGTSRFLNGFSNSPN